MKLVYCMIFFLLSLSLQANTLLCPKPCTNQNDCRRELMVNNKKLEYYSNFPINIANACISKVIYVVHGAERNAYSRYQAVLQAAISAKAEQRVLIISPFFKTPEDLPSTNDLYWSSSGWRQGNTSNNTGYQISSFGIADLMIANVITGGKFPALRTAAITGHSAGGQYTQMYALTSLITQRYPTINFRFLVLNPSNYTYLNTLRPYPNIPNYFEEPVYQTSSGLKMKPVYEAVAGRCPNSFNNYKYGLIERNNYSSDISNNNLINQYKNRLVYYFLGELDNNPNDDSMDLSCQAELQGATRLERGKNYFSHMNIYFRGHYHSLGTVPGVGHDASGMYAATNVKSALFNF